MSVWSPGTRALAIRLYREDEAYEDITAQTGVPRRTVNHWARAAGLPRRRSAHRLRLHDAVTRAYAVRLYAIGTSMLEIGAEVGVGHGAIRQWVVLAGLPLRTTGSHRRIDTHQILRLYGRLGTMKAVSEVLGCSRSTVSNHVAQARREGLL